MQVVMANGQIGLGKLICPFSNSWILDGFELIKKLSLANTENLFHKTLFL